MKWPGYRMYAEHNLNNYLSGAEKLSVVIYIDVTDDKEAEKELYSWLSGGCFGWLGVSPDGIKDLGFKTPFKEDEAKK